MRGLSLVAASGGHSSSQCAGLSLSRPLLLRSTGSRRAGSVVVAHGPSRSAACGIFPDQGSNPCPLHWQADSQPLRHRGSPNFILLHVPLQFSQHHLLKRLSFLHCIWVWVLLGDGPQSCFVFSLRLSVISSTKLGCPQGWDLLGLLSLPQVPLCFRNSQKKSSSMSSREAWG